jgi:hypothetical protein
LILPPPAANLARVRMAGVSLRPLWQNASEQTRHDPFQGCIADLLDEKAARRGARSGEKA